MPNIALIDFDNTITTADMFVPFVRYAVKSSHAPLIKILLAPVILGYKLKLISPSITRQIIAYAVFRGRHAKDIIEMGRYFSRTAVSQVIRPPMLERIAWHRSQGDEVVVVSASLNFYLDDWCRRHEVALICSELEVKSGVFTGRYLDGDCSGPGKVRKIRAKYDLTQYSMIYAYGDSEEDHEMMNTAHKKFFRGHEVSQIFGKNQRFNEAP